jgi:hypothetical protein
MFCSGIEPGACHVVEPDDVGLTLLGATERHEYADLGAEPERGHGDVVSRAFGAERQARGLHPTFGDQLLRDALVAVTLRDVGDLVPEHGGELILRPRDFEHAGENADLAPREREGVRLLAVEDDDLPLCGLGAVRREERASDTAHVGVGSPPFVDRLLLLHVLKRLAAHGVQIAVRNEQQLLPAGGRSGTRDAASCAEQEICREPGAERAGSRVEHLSPEPIRSEKRACHAFNLRLRLERAAWQIPTPRLRHGRTCG